MHDTWLRRQHFESDYDTVLSVKGRRERLDAAITTMAGDSEFTPVVRHGLDAHRTHVGAAAGRASEYAADQYAACAGCVAR